MNPPSVPDLLRAAHEAAGAPWAVLLVRATSGWDVVSRAGSVPAESQALAALADGLAPTAWDDVPGSPPITLTPDGRAMLVPVMPPGTVLLVGGAAAIDLAGPAAAALRGVAAGIAGLLEAERILANARQQNADAALLSEARRRADELAVMSRVGQAVHSTLDMDELLDRLMAEIRNVVNAEAASVLLWDEAQQTLTFSAAASPAAHSLVGLRVPSGQGVAGWVAQHRQAALVSDVRSDPRWLIRLATGDDPSQRKLQWLTRIPRNFPAGTKRRTSPTENEGKL